MLSNPALKPHYQTVTWLFVTRNFKDDATDREAARTHDRFGITSWPQIVVFDPRDDRVLAWLPRDLKGFTAGLLAHRDAVPAAGSAAQAAAAQLARAVQRHEAGAEDEALKLLAEIAAGRDEAGCWLHARELQRAWREEDPDPGSMLEDPDVRQRAIALERIAALDPAARTPHLDGAQRRLLDADEHLVVRLRALRALESSQPERVAEHAAELLAVPNDPFRFAVLTVLAATPRPELTPLLIELFAGAGRAVPSSNPNVLRVHVARCLGSCGDGRAVATLAPVARAAEVRNGLTGIVVDALAAIGERHPGESREQVIEVLGQSFPPALEDAGLEAVGARAEPWLLRSAERVRAALARLADDVPALPRAWKRADREAYLRALGN